MKCFADVGVKGAKGCAALTEKQCDNGKEVGFLDNMKIIRIIEKEYLQYRKNGGWISFLTFAHKWLKENKEIIRKAIDKND